MIMHVEIPRHSLFPKRRFSIINFIFNKLIQLTSNSIMKLMGYELVNLIIALTLFYETILFVQRYVLHHVNTNTQPHRKILF